VVDVVVDQGAPTGTLEILSVTISFHCDHASGVDSTTITLTLTDPQGTTHTPISLGVFDRANDWNGIVTTDGTGFDVAITEHDALMAGPWSASATADSLDGGDDGTETWTFSVTSVMGNILLLIKDILEGRKGTGRTIPVGNFEHFNFDEDDLGPGGAEGETRKFALGIVGSTDDGSIPAFVSGDYVQDAQVIRVSVFYAVEPNMMLNLEIDRARDNLLIRRALEWPENWCLTAGWTGAEVIAVTPEEIGGLDKPQVIAVSYDLQISIREKQG
jgi:hypothetical protein